MADLFNLLIFDPLYNALVGLVSFVPGAQLGIAVVLLTLFIKMMLLPLTLKASRVQKIVREMQPKLEALKKEHKDDRHALGLKTLELYRAHSINPFTLFIPLLIQIPVILGLFFVFARGGLPEIDPEILYSFVPIPEQIEMLLFGLLDVGAQSAPLALLVGITMYLQMRIVMPKIEPRTKDSTFGQDFQRSLNIQMKYVFPVFVVGFAYFLPSAVALYWTTSNIFQIGQELFVRRKGDTKDGAKDTSPEKAGNSLPAPSQGADEEKSGGVKHSEKQHQGKKKKKHKKR